MKHTPSKTATLDLGQYALERFNAELAVMAPEDFAEMEKKARSKLIAQAVEGRKRAYRAAMQNVDVNSVVEARIG